MSRIIESVVTLEDGFRVGVTRVGHKGTPLVFLHGLGVSARAYSELLVALADKGFRVIALDAADHGRSDSLPFGHTVADMVDITERTLAGLGITAAVMVGHSMGGGMAVEFAARYPERTMSAIILDAAAGQEHHDAIRVEPSPSLPFRAAQLLAGAVGDVIGDALRAGRVRSHRERLSLLGILRGSVSGPGVVKAAYALMRHDTVPLLKTMRDNKVPTVVMHGTKDRIIDFTSALSAAMLCGGSLFLIPGAFHSWMIAEPELGALRVAKAAEMAA
jgi:pimeloyl-ACP methyl ester carboxylesterase